MIILPIEGWVKSLLFNDEQRTSLWWSFMNLKIYQMKVKTYQLDKLTYSSWFTKTFYDRNMNLIKQLFNFCVVCFGISSTKVFRSSILAGFGRPDQKESTREEFLERKWAKHHLHVRRFNASFPRRKNFFLPLLKLKKPFSNTKRRQ